MPGTGFNGTHTQMTKTRMQFRMTFYFFMSFVVVVAESLSLLHKLSFELQNEFLTKRATNDCYPNMPPSITS